MGPRTFEPLGAVQIESYRGTQCVTLSAAVCLDLNNSKRFKSSRAHKFRRSGVSQSEEFVTGGDPPMGATSLLYWLWLVARALKPSTPGGQSARATPPWSSQVAERSFAAAMLSLAVAAAGSTLDPGGGAPGAGSEAVDLPLIHRTPTFFVPPIGHRSTAFLDLVTALGGGLRTKLDAPTASSGRVPKVITH